MESQYAQDALRDGGRRGAHHTVRLCSVQRNSCWTCLPRGHRQGSDRAVSMRSRWLSSCHSCGACGACGRFVKSKRRQTKVETQNCKQKHIVSWLHTTHVSRHELETDRPTPSKNSYSNRGPPPHGVGVSCHGETPTERDSAKSKSRTRASD